MSRESLISIVKKADKIVRLLATGPNGMVGDTSHILGQEMLNRKHDPEKNGPFAPGPVKNFTNLNQPNVTDTSARTISAITGFLDGAFQAPNTSYCRMSLILMSSSMQNFIIAFDERNQNFTVWFATRILKYVNPVLFHCFYMGVEAE
jgi:hypothetical protein